MFTITDLMAFQLTCSWNTLCTARASRFGKAISVSLLSSSLRSALFTCLSHSRYIKQLKMRSTQAEGPVSSERVLISIQLKEASGTVLIGTRLLQRAPATSCQMTMLPLAIYAAGALPNAIHPESNRAAFEQGQLPVRQLGSRRPRGRRRRTLTSAVT